MADSIVVNTQQTSTHLTEENITQAIQAINAYIKTAKELASQINATVMQLRATNFIGDASTGYDSFYTNNVVPVITKALYDTDGSNTGDSLTGALIMTLNSIKDTLLNTTDPELMKFNMNPNNQNQPAQPATT